MLVVLSLVIKDVCRIGIVDRIEWNNYWLKLLKEKDPGFKFF